MVAALAVAAAISDANDEDAMDSEEEEIRKVEALTRHRKKNGQIARRRWRAMRPRGQKYYKVTPDHNGCDDDDTSDEDEVPLAILQRRMERASKARERKLCDMILMVNRQDRQLLLPSRNAMQKKGKLPAKKHSNRTKP